MEHAEVHTHIVPSRVFVRVWLRFVGPYHDTCGREQALSPDAVDLGHADPDAGEGGACAFLFHAY